MGVAEAPAPGTPCCKCAAPSVLCVRRLPYCQPCYLEHIRLRFHQTLAKLPLPPSKQGVQGTGPSLCVGVSGGLGSLCLLQLLHDIRTYVPPGMTAEQRQGWQPRFPTLTAVHIMEGGGAFGGEGAGGNGAQGAGEHPDPREVERVASRYCDAYVQLPLSAVFSGGAAMLQAATPAHSGAAAPSGLDVAHAMDVVPRPSDVGPEALLHQCLSTTTPTSRRELVDQWRHVLLEQAARDAGASALLTGETMSRTAINVILDTCLGKGFTLPQTTALFTRLPVREGGAQGLLHARPLSDLLQEEVQHFWRMQGMEAELGYCAPGSRNPVPVIGPAVRGRSKAGRSVHQLVEDFLHGLQQDYPYTMNTTARTGRKVTTGAAASLASGAEQAETCIVCGDPVEPGCVSWRQAHTHSSLEEGSPQLHRSSHAAPGSVPVAQLSCYACQNLYADAAGVWEARTRAARRERHVPSAPPPRPSSPWILPSHVAQRVAGQRVLASMQAPLLPGGEEECP